MTRTKTTGENDEITTQKAKKTWRVREFENDRRIRAKRFPRILFAKISKNSKIVRFGNKRVDSSAEFRRQFPHRIQ